MQPTRYTQHSMPTEGACASSMTKEELSMLDLGKGSKKPQPRATAFTSQQQLQNRCGALHVTVHERLRRRRLAGPDCT
eukprot:12119809-Alexandrium_andersonii.AAC.1